jgi:urease accessory protein
VLRRLYPEGPGICHHVIVHPPGGVVGGDRLEVQAGSSRHARAGHHARRHALLPQRRRHRVQQATLQLADGARLEWLPLETIAHRDCIAENRVSLQLAPGAEAMGWDLLALGLPVWAAWRENFWSKSASSPPWMVNLMLCFL